MSDEDILYEVGIQTQASPQEVFEFTELLEGEGYEVVTDLKHGALEIRESNE